MESRKKLIHGATSHYQAGDIVGVQNTCTLCGRRLAKFKIIETVNGVDYIFDKEYCALTFKKLESVYGSEFLALLTD